MSAEDLENYETDMELQLYREYRDVVGLFSYVVETERRFYLANHVDLQARSADGEVYFDLTLQDAWVWDVYRSARFVKSVRVITFKDVNVEELPAQRGTGAAQGRRPGQLSPDPQGFTGARPEDPVPPQPCFSGILPPSRIPATYPHSVPCPVPRDPAAAGWMRRWI